MGKENCDKASFLDIFLSNKLVRFVNPITILIFCIGTWVCIISTIIKLI